MPQGIRNRVAVCPRHGTNLALRYLAEGEWHISVLDWVIQRLKKMGLAEERGGSTMTTKEGQRALGRITALT